MIKQQPFVLAAAVGAALLSNAAQAGQCPERGFRLFCLRPILFHDSLGRQGRRPMGDEARNVERSGYCRLCARPASGSRGASEKPIRRAARSATATGRRRRIAWKFAIRPKGLYGHVPAVGPRKRPRRFAGQPPDRPIDRSGYADAATASVAMPPAAVPQPSFQLPPMANMASNAPNGLLGLLFGGGMPACAKLVCRR
jgi:hypothetical protein